MRINTKYSMSTIDKVFKYEETELSVIKCKDDIWFRGKMLAEVLGYSNTLKAIHTHVDSEDKKEMSELGYKGGCPFLGTPLGMYSEGLSTLMNPGHLLLSFVLS